MVVTRLSHVGEACPLRDHSYSDFAIAKSEQKKSDVKVVATRQSHEGEDCPLRDHSYSDPVGLLSSGSQASSSRRIIVLPKVGSQDASLMDVGGEVSRPNSPQSPRPHVLHILEFPTEIIEKILSFVSFKNICEIRRVCKRFDKIGGNLLNLAFQRLQSKMLNRFQATKSQMPRRESARRTHPLARESEILEMLHMRLTLLQMTFGKHIERKHCCFFAGEILDEVYRILRCVKSTPKVGKVFKITDELFDLTSMAMEYFKEHIEPGLPEISYFGSDFLDISTRFSEGGSSRSSGGSGRVSEPEDDLPERDPLPPSNMVLRKRIKKIRQGMKRYNTQLVTMRRDLRTTKGRVVEQNKQILDLVTRMEEQDKKLDESSRKLSTVLQELNKCKTELQYWRSKSPVHPMCVYCHCRLSTSGEVASGTSDAMWPARESEERPEVGPLPEIRSPYYPAPPSPSPSSSVKNLEPLFDLDTLSFGSASVGGVGPLPLTPHSCSPLFSSSLLPSSSSYHLPPLPFGGDDFSADFASEGSHKRSSSDEDTDDVDTVGRRVKERKRIKLDPR